MPYQASIPHIELRMRLWGRLGFVEYDVGGSVEPKLQMRFVRDDSKERKTFLESTWERYF